MEMSEVLHIMNSLKNGGLLGLDELMAFLTLLEYIKIKEPPYFGAIQASIDPKEEDNKNKETFKNKLLPEFIKLRNSYKGCRYRIDLISDEDLSKLK